MVGNSFEGIVKGSGEFGDLEAALEGGAGGGIAAALGGVTMISARLRRRLAVENLVAVHGNVLLGR
jgi:hypothetical protein